MGVHVKTNRITVCILAMLVIFCYLALNVSSAQAKDEATLSGNEISVTLTTSGGSSATSATLDRNTYHEGDVVYLTWRGAAVGNDFYIPTSITYGSKKLNTNDLVRLDTAQSANSEYERRMGSAGTMTDYDSLKASLLKEKSVSLGQLTMSTIVNVEFTRVTPVYRMYNMITSEHLFTTNKEEYDSFVALGMNDRDTWIGEGISWLAPSSGTKTVHRLYNSGLGRMGSSSHYYTSDESEISNLLTQGWSDDGVDNQFKSGGSVAIYTCYNEALGSAHHYTSSKTEWESLAAHGWNLEGDKNGSSGVFSGIMATSWSYSGNYYIVEHKIDGIVIDTQFVSGKLGERTAAKGLSYPGYEAYSSSVATIASDNSTTVQIAYKRNVYEVTFDGNGQSLEVADQSVEYGGIIEDPGKQNVGGYVFEGWYFDSAGTKPFNFDNDTMPAGDLRLYAKWSENKLVRYVVLHRYQKTDGLYPELDANGNPEEGIEYEYKYGTIGTTTNEVARKTSGFNRATVFQRTLVENTSSLNPDTGWPDLNPDTQLPDNWVDIRYERNKHNLTFDLNGHGVFGNLDVDAGYVVKNDKATIELMQGQTIESIVPSDVNYNFAGWYTDAACQHHWGHGGDGSRDMPDSDMTLYACWTLGKVYQLTFETNGADGGNFYPYEVAQGTTPQRPDPDPTRNGYVFKGWYKDKDLTEEFNFDTVINANTTIYAKWEPKSDTSYVVVHKKQNLDGTYTNAETESETRVGTTGALTLASASKNWVGFSAVLPIEQKEIAGDESTVVEILYSRNVHNIYFETNGQPVDFPTISAMYGSKITQPTTEPIVNGFTFSGWYSDSDCKNAFAFGEVLMPDSDVKLYAKWTLTSDFWLAPSSRITTGNTAQTVNVENLNYSGAERGILKLESELLDDAATLAAGSSSPAYERVYKQYSEYMEKDNYHLYVKWNGDTTDSSGEEQSENGYVEFRIIDVGQHDGDGSGLTFQAIHSLPKSYVMNEAASNVWGWDRSNLSSRKLWFGTTTQGVVYNTGEIAGSFEHGFLSAIKPVVKTTSAGGESTSIRYTEFGFWLLSYKEITGTNQSFVSQEGVQYPYYSNLDILAYDDNLALYRLSRAQNNPAGQSTLAWWTRSPTLINSTSFIAIGGVGSSGGNPSSLKFANSNLGVVLAFCL